MRKKIVHYPSVLEVCQNLLPQDAVIYLLDSRFSHYAAFFSDKTSVKQIYVFDSRHGKKRKALLPKVVYIKPIWKKERFVSVEAGKEMTVQLEAPDLLHISERKLSTDILTDIKVILKTARPMIWLEQNQSWEAKITRWMAENQYILQQKIGNQALYVFQRIEQDEAPQAGDPADDGQTKEAEIKKRLEQNILELVEVSKTQFAYAHAALEEKFIQQETALKVAMGQQDLLKKQHQIEIDQLKGAHDKAMTALRTQQVRAMAEQKTAVQQLQNELASTKEMVRYMSEALNAEKAVNHDLNRHILNLLDEELPILQELERCNQAQEQELKRLKAENKKMTQKLADITEKYRRLNETKVMKWMRRYWQFKKRRRLRKKREEN
ncbi:hypothetical protein [Listeria costaricensis]|uniref:hypothetical protein n=1 Tax=Listeria costaricensis TaxID=2026604 RepID=UPI000C08C96A|nr:hypothetical protein [Listeria costaricensis]